MECITRHDPFPKINERQNFHNVTFVLIVESLKSLLFRIINFELQWSYERRLFFYVTSALLRPYKHTTWISRWNDVETVVASTSFQRGIHMVCLQGFYSFYIIAEMLKYK